MEIITRNYNNIEVVFGNSESIYINATQIAKQFNKQSNDWLRLKDTKAYIEALSRNGNSRFGDLVAVRKGGNDKNAQGTWIHKKLIIAFARWLSPEFAVWCDQQIEEILSQNQPFKSEIPDLDYLRKRTEQIETSTKQLIAFKKSFHEIGIRREEELIVTSNRAVAKETGVDFIELAELKGIPTPEKYFTVTELCQKVMDSDNFSDESKKLVSTKAGDKPTEKAKDFSDFAIYFAIMLI
ncbi:KilA-N domain-containing protein [Thiovulum sp. ES]|nr:KilA-N domain-containing protein [Thiovulum sp. ES]